MHEIRIQDTYYGLMGDDEEVVLLALQLQDDGFQPDGQVMIGLWQVSTSS